MKRTIVVLSFIVLIASVLRLWNLGNVPPSPNWDEAALGYNAYSIMLTGKDEYGNKFPMVLRSYDDYKPALYAYFIIPFIKIFGLEVFGVRLPSVIFGILGVLATYFLVKEIFSEKKLAYISSFLLAISPWHIQFSRIAFESNVGLAFNIFSVLFFLKGLRKPVFLILAFVIAAANLYIYQSEKVFTPLVFLALALIFRNQIFKLPKKYLLTSLILGAVIATPLILYTFTNQDALARAKGVSIFSGQTEFLKESAFRIAESKEKNDILGIIFNNRRVVYAKEIISGYISHYNLNWLFIKGDIARHHAPFMGLLYLWELPFFFFGLYNLVFGNFDRKAKLLILAWFLIAPIPASITSGVPHAVRTLNFLPTFQIFIAIGLVFIFRIISEMKYKIFKIHLKYFAVSLYFLFIMFNFFYYLNQYFVQLNYFTSLDWQYGYKQAIEEVRKLDNKYSKIVVSNTPYMDQSYMFFLFYLQYSPDKYQNESQNASGGFDETHKFGKYEFRPINWNKEIKKRTTLFVGRTQDFPPVHLGHVKTINFINGTAGIKLVEGNDK